MRAPLPTIAAFLIALVLQACASTGTAPSSPSTTPSTTKPAAPSTATPPPATTPVGPERAQRTQRALNMTGFPPEYQRGWRDGCASVGSAASTPPAGLDAQSSQGWKDGFTYCTKRRPA